MFKLIVALFAIVNGVQSETPSGVLEYNRATFPTQESCLGFIESEAGREVRQAAIAFALQRQSMPRFGCVESKTEDNTI